jgi:anti-sigma B factor antagonist
MLVEQRKTDNILILDVEGEINIYNAPRLKELVLDLNAEGLVKIILNFEKIPYIDSTAIGTFISLKIHMEKQNGHFAFINIGEEIKMVLSITKMIHFFNVYNSEEDAIKKLSE